MHRLAAHGPGEGERAVVLDDEDLCARTGAARFPTPGRRFAVQRATDALSTVLGAHGDLEVGEVRVVLEGVAELGDAEDPVDRRRREEVSLEVVARLGDLDAKGVERAAYGVGPVVRDRAVLRFEPRPELSSSWTSISRISMRAIGTDRCWSAPTNCAMLEDMTDQRPTSKHCPRTGSAPCASWRTPTTWSSERPPRWRAGPPRARRSSTAW